ncbi:NADPH-dependent FMN reductase [Marinomonas algicola]|uniref:NADPH-dependent FMN reductase n=1 Tax=Marinomonas algicola TaxID=2773454 RepID=UPI00174CE324|nr:NAD(P)H-dependent oxidoreductase [Marinomonas algicola]
MNILLLSGRFHSKSKSLSILHFLQDAFPEHQFQLPKLDLLPFYTDDLNENKPDNVQDLIDQMALSDGIIVCSPE